MPDGDSFLLYTMFRGIFCSKASANELLWKRFSEEGGRLDTSNLETDMANLRCSGNTYKVQCGLSMRENKTLPAKYSTYSTGSLS